MKVLTGPLAQLRKGADMNAWWKYTFLYWLGRKRENAAIWLVSRLPRWVIYRSVIRAAVKDEEGHPGEVTALEMLRKFEP